ncbi:MAG: 30S ribosomal protein S14 [Candidatus Pacearchaeota archaeon]
MRRFLKYNKPKERKYGAAKKPCVRCGRIGAHIRSYGLELCRQCFREIAEELGFKKYQ